MKNKISIGCLLLALAIVGCKKEASTSSSTNNTTSTTSTTSSAGAQTLTVDGVSWPKTATGCDVSPYNYVFFTGTSGSCQVIFASVPATGSYTTNWATLLSGSQCKIVLLDPSSNTEHYCVDGATVNVTNTSGKIRVSFANIGFKPDLQSQTVTKSVSGNFGCD